MTSLREDRVRELTRGLFRDEIVDRLFKLIHEREFELFEMYVRIANRGINGNDRDKKGETLLVAACESGSARTVQFLMDIPGTDPARRGSQYQHRNNSTAFLLPVHAAYYWKNVHKTDRDVVEVLDVLHKSGAELYIDTKLSRSSISHDYFPLDLFVVYGWMERSLEAEKNVPVILKLMRMGAWRVDKRRYFQTSANFADGYDTFNENTWSLIESRRALMVLKARSAGTMRCAVPKELWTLVRSAGGAVNGNTMDKYGETLLVMACEGGCARTVQFLLDIPGTDPAKKGERNRFTSDAVLLRPVHAAVYWKSYEKTVHDVVAVLDVLYKSGKKLDIDEKLDSPSLGFDYFPLDVFCLHEYMDYPRTNQSLMILKLMQMGAWRVEKARYIRAHDDSIPLRILVANARTWSLIESRRTLQVLKQRSAGTMRGAVPKELWKKLIQMLAFT